MYACICMYIGLRRSCRWIILPTFRLKHDMDAIRLKNPLLSLLSWRQRQKRKWANVFDSTVKRAGRITSSHSEVVSGILSFRIGPNHRYIHSYIYIYELNAHSTRPNCTWPRDLSEVSALSTVFAGYCGWTQIKHCGIITANWKIDYLNTDRPSTCSLCRQV